MSELLLRHHAFEERIARREARIGIVGPRPRIGIVGLGYPGLPLGLTFAEAGFDVTGIDLNESRVAAVNDRRSYLIDVPEARYECLKNRLRATSEYSAIAELDALTICVPTPLSKTRTPDVSYVVAAAEAVAQHLRPGQLVVLLSTTYPGTTEEVVLPLLESWGGTVGEDFFLGYAPERVDPGNKHYTIKTTPKLVSGVTPKCLRRTSCSLVGQGNVDRAKGVLVEIGHLRHHRARGRGRPCQRSGRRRPR
jgi:UDP-N-acetyl-D-glucosamine dehydrogenase